MRATTGLVTILLGCGCAASALADTADRPGFGWAPADRIVVEKSRRLLRLVRADGTERSFPVSLGGNPVGHKVHQGDSRTPEGSYFVDYKLIDSQFYLALRISYPNEADRARARARGADPGGNIMIHGVPNDADRPARYLGQDWTEGCIAVSNDAMQEIWLATRESTLVEIRP